MSDIKIGSVWVDKVDKSTLEILRENYDGRYYVNTSDGGECYISHANIVEHYEQKGRKDDSTKPKAVELLETSAATLIRCGKKYDSTGNNSERVMDRIVDMFNAATGHKLSEAQGNIFMVCLKVVRSETSTYHDDDHYIDGVNYFAMAGEAASEAADD